MNFVNTEDKFSNTPFHYAIKNEYGEIIKIILSSD